MSICQNATFSIVRCCIVFIVLLFSCTEEKQKPLKNPFDSTLAWNPYGTPLNQEQHDQFTVCGNSHQALEMYNAFKWIERYNTLKCKGYLIKRNNISRFMDEIQKPGIYTIPNYKPYAIDDTLQGANYSTYYLDSVFVKKFPGGNFILKLNKQDSVPLNVAFSMNETEKSIEMKICTDAKNSQKFNSLLLKKQLARKMPE